MPYVRPLAGSPKTALRMGTPKMIVEIQVNANHVTATWPVPPVVPLLLPPNPPPGKGCHDKAQDQADHAQDEEGDDERPQEGVSIEIHADTNALEDVQGQGNVKYKFCCLG